MLYGMVLPRIDAYPTVPRASGLRHASLGGHHWAVSGSEAYASGSGGCVCMRE